MRRIEGPTCIPERTRVACFGVKLPNTRRFCLRRDDMERTRADQGVLMQLLMCRWALEDFYLFLNEYLMECNFFWSFDGVMNAFNAKYAHSMSNSIPKSTKKYRSIPNGGVQWRMNPFNVKWVRPLQQKQLNQEINTFNVNRMRSLLSRRPTLISSEHSGPCERSRHHHSATPQLSDN